jgi:hypothetical protein
VTLVAIIQEAEQQVRRTWESDTVRLVVLTLYYVGIIIGLAVIHGNRLYTPPPFIYQEF